MDRRTFFSAIIAALLGSQPARTSDISDWCAVDLSPWPSDTVFLGKRDGHIRMFSHPDIKPLVLKCRWRTSYLAGNLDTLGGLRS